MDYYFLMQHILMLFHFYNDILELHLFDILLLIECIYHHCNPLLFLDLHLNK